MAGPWLSAPDRTADFAGEQRTHSDYALNIGLGVLSVALVYRLTSRLFDWQAGLIAAAICAVFPGLWLWAPIVSAENLSVPMLLAISALLVGPLSIWRLPLIGLLTGALVFVRPSALFFITVVVISVILLAQPRQRLRNVGVLVIGLALSMGAIASLNIRAGGPALPVGASGWQPWLVYNERATGEWFPAQDRDDYPFHGLEDDPALSAIVRSAQVKLAVQYALMNPAEILPGLIHRHVRNWHRDDAGLDWTVRRAGSPPYASFLSTALDGIVSRAYLLVHVCGGWPSGPVQAAWRW